MKPFHPTAILAVSLNGQRTVLTAHSVRHDATLRALRKLAAARLLNIADEHREAEAAKQETSGVPAPKASTTHPLYTQEARAASAQFATAGRQS